MDLEEREDPEPKALVYLEPHIDPHSELKVALVGEQISVHSSSDIEEVTMLGFTFRGVPLVILDAFVCGLFLEECMLGPSPNQFLHKLTGGMGKLTGFVRVRVEYLRLWIHGTFQVMKSDVVIYLLCCST